MSNTYDHDSENEDFKVESIAELEMPDKSRSNLGEGAYASVRLVRHKKLGREFALKEIDLLKSVQRISLEKKLELVKREIKLHKNLKHKNVVRLYDYFKIKDKVYLLMELAEKGNLFNLIKLKGHFSDSEAISMFLQVVRGVQYLHFKDVIHRDLKVTLQS